MKRIAVVGVVVLIALVAAYNARQPMLPSLKVRRTPKPDEAHVAACAAITKAVDAPLIFDASYTLDGDQLTTAALLSGQQVDITAVVKWNGQAWDVIEARLGGAVIPISE